MAPTPQTAETVMGFIERVGLPFSLVFLLIGLFAAAARYFFQALLAEMKAMTAALTKLNESNARLSDEVSGQHRVPEPLRKRPEGGGT